MKVLRTNGKEQMVGYFIGPLEDLTQKTITTNENDHIDDTLEVVEETTVNRIPED